MLRIGQASTSSNGFGKPAHRFETLHGDALREPADRRPGQRVHDLVNPAPRRCSCWPPWFFCDLPVRPAPPSRRTVRRRTTAQVAADLGLRFCSRLSRLWSSSRLRRRWASAGSASLTPSSPPCARQADRAEVFAGGSQIAIGWDGPDGQPLSRGRYPAPGECARRPSSLAFEYLGSHRKTRETSPKASVDCGVKGSPSASR